LEKFNVCLIDFYNFEFNIVSTRYGINETCVDLTETVRTFLNDNIFNIGSDVNLNNISINPVDFYKKNYFIDLNPNNIKLYITYSINNIFFHEEYEQANGFLLRPILIDLVNVKFEKSMVRNDQSEFCTSFLKHLTFQPKFALSAQNFIVNNVKTQNINCIHLRLEYDALKHWSKENNMSMREFKKIMEDRYISEIERSIYKSDTTIVLASNYDNRVIKYLLDNKYTIIIAFIVCKINNFEEDDNDDNNDDVDIDNNDVICIDLIYIIDIIYSTITNDIILFFIDFNLH
jgi:hypothetical protein